MTAAHRRSSVALWLLIAVALAVTVLSTVYLVRWVAPPPPGTRSASGPVGHDGPPEPVAPGIAARITAGGVTVQRDLTAPAFSLQPGQSLDLRLPAGAFEAEVTVAFDPGAVRRAQLGAEIRNATLVVDRRGREVASGSAGDVPAVIMSQPVYLSGRVASCVYRIRADGAGPVQWRALWRPDEAQSNLPLVGDGGSLLPRPAERGAALLSRLNCVACHEAGADPVLVESPAPRLDQVGARARPEWLRQWLADPDGTRHGALMPALLDPGDPADQQTLEDLVHFLASLGGPFQEAAGPRPELVATGRALYRRVGCVACHGPLDDDDGDGAAWVAHPQLALKTSVPQLAAFLRDPVAVRPAGRMPSLRLGELEAESIASYLVQRDLDTRGSLAPQPLQPDPARVARGREAFATRGCAACHALTPPIESRLAAPPLQSLDPQRGCLAPEPPPGVPDFHLGPAQRDDLAAALRERPQWRADDAPLVRLATAMERLNCLACHRFHGAGGVPASIDRLFTTLEEADLGDEGRLPPVLDYVGWRLNPGWLHQVLEHAGTARPYMAARMPQFGAANVEPLPALFVAAAGAAVTPRPGPPMGGEYADAGRGLVGAKGLNCIQCHSIAGRAATGLPGPDLVQMVERLRYGWFDLWLHDPRLLRPGTRMPTFFYGGTSGAPQLDADAQRQIDAMWSYLSLGEFLPLPDGLVDPTALQVEVGDEPVVLRTFMTGIGPRAIACGFPQGVHFAFDAATCRLREVWTGRFLNAAGAWAARGGTEIGPDQPLSWSAPPGPLLTGADGAEPVPQFHGYLLDAGRRPVFEYDLLLGPATLSVKDQAQPDGTQALHRRLEVRGPAGTKLKVVPAAGQRLVGAQPPADGDVLVLDGQGRLIVELEVTW